MSVRPVPTVPAAPRRRRRLRRAVTVFLATATLVAVAGPASAHVTVHADDDHQGTSDAVLSFRVPNEEDTATTTKVAISFPTRTPLASVKPAPVAGWSFTTTPTTFNPPIKTDDGTITTGVGQVVYTANSAASAIPVGGFENFQILVGPLPDKATQLAFPTVQTYSSGKIVSWVQPVTDPNNPPDNPAPVLALEPASASDTGQVSASPSTAAMASGSMATRSDVSNARTLAWIALAIAVLGALATAGSVVAGRRRP